MQLATRNIHSLCMDTYMHRYTTQISSHIYTPANVSTHSNKCRSHTPSAWHRCHRHRHRCHQQHKSRSHCRRQIVLCPQQKFTKVTSQIHDPKRKARNSPRRRKKLSYINNLTTRMVQNPRIRSMDQRQSWKIRPQQVQSTQHNSQSTRNWNSVATGRLRKEFVVEIATKLKMWTCEFALIFV